MPPRDREYKPQDTLALAGKQTLIFGGVGLFVASIRSAVVRENIGMSGMFTRFGGIVTNAAAVGGVYEFSRIAAANLRQKNDHYNEAIGGFFAGSVMGLRTGRIPNILGLGAFTAVVLAVYDYTGGKLSGYDRDPEVDEYARKEALRKNRRRPIEETIADVGETKGGMFRPPGYEERRRQRLKERYGVDINPVSADPNKIA